MAPHVGSARIWRGGGRIIYGLVESGNFPGTGRASVRAFYRDAWGLGSHRWLGFR
jgi:hypothetical protein